MASLQGDAYEINQYSMTGCIFVIDDTENVIKKSGNWKVFNLEDKSNTFWINYQLVTDVVYKDSQNRKLTFKYFYKGNLLHDAWQSKNPTIWGLFIWLYMFINVTIVSVLLINYDKKIYYRNKTIDLYFDMASDLKSGIKELQKYNNSINEKNEIENRMKMDEKTDEIINTIKQFLKKYRDENGGV